VKKEESQQNHYKRGVEIAILTHFAFVFGNRFLFIRKTLKNGLLN
jgi:hypothetical protein